ncbi:hypothetical protein [Haladaptatus salinisoli]|uniref:hypothetical protein n=1 Tax=Haladaptatus salinisoli TaxID=2884876 RepID=UPI001D0B873C|nr:hypothetical protein [Haladaptatus salinisoli]
MGTPESKRRVENPTFEGSDTRAETGTERERDARSSPMWGFWTALFLSSVFGLFLWFGVVSVLFGYELLSVFFVLLGCLFISTASRLVA